jgi:hypothetical protein
MQESMTGAWMMMVLMKIDDGACFSQVSYSYPFNNVMVALVRIYGGGTALPCQDVTIPVFFVKECFGGGTYGNDSPASRLLVAY